MVSVVEPASSALSRTIKICAALMRRPVTNVTSARTGIIVRYAAPTIQWTMNA